MNTNDNIESESEQEEYTEGQEKCKAPTPLTKSSIEDLPSTLITSIYCAEGCLDDVSDDVFAWKKVPTQKMTNKKVDAKLNAMNFNNKIKRQNSSILAGTTITIAPPPAPGQKTGDTLAVIVPKMSSTAMLKQKSDVKQVKNVKSKKNLNNTSKDSLLKSSRKLQRDSKLNASDRKPARIASSSLIKQKDSKIKLTYKNQNKK